MAAGSWLDDDPYAYQQPDPYGASPSPQTSADPGAGLTPGKPDVPPSSDWNASPDASGATGSPTPPAASPSVAPAGGYASDLGQASPLASVNPADVQAAASRGGVTGVGSAASPAGDVARYQSQLDAVHSATDPQSKAAAQDALARQLQQDLTADGHKVTWKGNTMMVDGRAYELAGEGVAAGTFGGPGGYQNIPGFEQSRLNDPNDNEPKTEFGRYAASLGGHLTGDDVRAFVASDPRWEIDPSSSPDDPRIRVKQAALDLWKPGQSIWQDSIVDSGPGGANIAHFENAGPAAPAGGGGRSATPGAGGGAGAPSSAYASPYDAPNYTLPIGTPFTSSSGTPAGGTTDWLSEFGMGSVLSPGGGPMTGATGLLHPDGTTGADWTPTGDPIRDAATHPQASPGQTPGRVPQEKAPAPPDGTAAAPDASASLPDHAVDPNSPYVPAYLDENLGLPNFDQLYGEAAQSSATDNQTEQLVQKLLQNPDSLSATDVETLKAKNAEEAAVAAQQQDQELQHYGYGAGLDSSPWLAGQRATNDWNRRAATIGSNRSVDIAAANTRSADRRSAATLGESFASYQTAKKQTALNFAVNSALQMASEGRNRRSLNESLAQAASSMGLQKEDLVLAYIKTNMGYDVDIKKLQAQSDQFQKDLLLRISQLQQADAQFKASYGLDAQKFNHTVDQDYWQRAKDTYAGATA